MILRYDTLMERVESSPCLHVTKTLLFHINTYSQGVRDKIGRYEVSYELVTPQYHTYLGSLPTQD